MIKRLADLESEKYKEEAQRLCDLWEQTAYFQEVIRREDQGEIVSDEEYYGKKDRFFEKHASAEWLKRDNEIKKTYDEAEKHLKERSLIYKL